MSPATATLAHPIAPLRQAAQAAEATNVDQTTTTTSMSTGSFGSPPTIRLVLPLPSLIQALPQPVAELFRHSGRSGLDWLLDSRVCPSCQRSQIQGNALWAWLQSQTGGSVLENHFGLDCLDCRRSLGVWSLEGLRSSLARV